MSSGKIKLIALSVILIISTLILGYTLFVFKSDFSLGAGINLGIALIVFLAIFVFQSFLVSRTYLIIGLCFLETLALLIPFYKSFSLILAGAGVVVFFLLWSASRFGQKDLTNVIKIDFIKTASQINARVSVAIILIGVVSYVSALTFSDITTSVVSSTDTVTEQVIARFVPEAAAAGNLINQVRGMILGQLDIIPEVVKKAVVVIFGVLLFFGIKGVMFIVNWLAAIVAWLIYKALVASGFIAVVTENVAREKIVLRQ